MTNETGDAGASPNGGGNARTWWIVGGVVAAIAIIVAIVAATGGGDDEETTTTVAADTTTTTAAEETTTTAAEETTTTAAEETTTTTSGEVEVEPILACQVTDTGGIDDKSFNQTAYKGITDAIAAGYATEDSFFLESQTETDYAPNIQSTLEQGCELIITVGFLLGDATAEAATANPEQPFTILDFAYDDPPSPNVVGAIFDTAPAAFLSGYTAAGMSQTGVVATYGGIQLPGAVTAFMDGFVWGVRYYNAENGTNVQVLGWNPEEQTGTFTGDFEDTTKGKNVTQSFIDEGADVILPVAGPVGEGSAQAAQENSTGDNPIWVVGVDADWFQTLPQYSDVILTSVLKGLDVAVFTEIKDVAEGTFEGGTRLFTLAEDGVGLGPFNDAVPAELQTAVDGVRAGLIDGSIPVEQPAG